MHPGRETWREEGNHKYMWRDYTTTVLPNMEQLYFATNGNDNFEVLDE